MKTMPAASLTAALLALQLVMVGIPTARAQEGGASATEPTPFGLFLETKQVTVPLPLWSTKVRGSVRGFVAEVRVTQVYVNPYADFIEARYVFPLPESAAVTAMVMHLADRDVVAEVKPRAEAERIYEEAVASGRAASLLNQERPNIFTQKVGNIPPGDKVEVELTYVEALTYEAGVSSLVFPTVVGPRYVPGAPLARLDVEPDARLSDTDQVPDASRITPPALAENETSVHELDLELDVDPGVAIAAITSPSHLLELTHESAVRARVRLAPHDRAMNKDFILRIDLRSARPAVAILAHRDGDGSGYLTLAVQPPSFEAATAPTPSAKDLYFVLDTSGSMAGWPLAAAKDLVREALKNLNPSDRFMIMRFALDVSDLAEAPLANTPENVARGLAFIDRLEGGGGTEMLSGIRHALDGKPEPGRVRIVFFLTDGYIGNDDEIIAAVRSDNQADARLFSMGVGTSVNRYLLSSMARAGRGEAQVMRPDEPVAPFVSRFYARVRNPVLTDIAIDWGTLGVSDQTPPTIPDLFSGQPLLVHARYAAPAHGKLTIRGHLGAKPWQQTLTVTLPERADRPAVPALWARATIQTLLDEETVRPGAHADEVTGLALAHGLMSPYTSFVAVDHVVARPATAPLIPVTQRLPLPEGVSRLALGDLSRRQIPPGDPILTIAAPPDARRVTAYFPFGLVKELSYDTVRGVWRGRFLVPAGIADGRYTIVIAVELTSGAIEYHRESYDLDSSAADFEAVLSGETVGRGGELDLIVDSVEAAAEVYVHCPEAGWERLPLSPFGNRRVDWHVHLPVSLHAEPGSYDVLVVVRDLAGNRFEQHLDLTIVGAQTPEE